MLLFVFFKQKTAYDMRISDWSSDVCSSDLLMLGLGETDDEIEQAIIDIRAANVDVVTFGQYMRPTKNHLPVQRFVTPDEFNAYRDLALSKGFLEVVSGPLVRSSYRAERVLNHDNVGL